VGASGWDVSGKKKMGSTGGIDRKKGAGAVKPPKRV